MTDSEHGDYDRASRRHAVFRLALGFFALLLMLTWFQTIVWAVNASMLPIERQDGLDMVPEYFASPAFVIFVLPAIVLILMDRWLWLALVLLVATPLRFAVPWFGFSLVMPFLH